MEDHSWTDSHWGRKGEREKEREKEEEKGRGKEEEREREKEDKGRERKREREREEERGRKRRTLDRNGTPPPCAPPMVGSVGLGGTGDQDEWDFIHLDGQEWMEGHS